MVLDLGESVGIFFEQTVVEIVTDVSAAAVGKTDQIGKSGDLGLVIVRVLE